MSGENDNTTHTENPDSGSHSGQTEKNSARKSRQQESDNTKTSGEKKLSETVSKEKYMSFTDHLEELRERLIKCIISVAVLAIGAFYFSDAILRFLLIPNPGVKLQMLKPTTGFMIHLKVGFYTGIIVGVPVIAYHLWKFIAPGLFPKERRYVVPVVFFTAICFLIGAAFSFFAVIPFGLKFLRTFETDYMRAQWTIDDYINFVTMMMLAFGCVFELPLIALFLGRVGLINHKMMSKYRRHAIVGAAIVGGILTPPDPYTQILLGVPLWILYEISIFLVRIFGKKRTEENI